MELVHKWLWDEMTQSWLTVIEFVDMSDHVGRGHGAGDGYGYEKGRASWRERV